MPFKKHILLYALSCLLLLSGCERVIDINLNSASRRYVIEALVTDGPGPHTVKLTQTKDFDENNTFDGIPGAEVILSDNAGNSETLFFNEEGFYQTSSLEGVPGRSYSLTVRIEGQTFQSVSTMPEPVPIDSIYVREFRYFNETIKIPYVQFDDPPGVRNFYRHLLFINGERIMNFFIRSDERFNGFTTERALPYFRGSEETRLLSGDVVLVEQQSIDESVFTYLLSLDQTIDQDAATPANPISNISGGALGYFSAYSRVSATLVIE